MWDFTKWGVRARRTARTPTSQPDGDTIVLGTTERGDQIHWPSYSRAEASHVAVFGASGAGKTVLVTHAIVEEFVRGQAASAAQRPSYFVTDPKGDLARHLVDALAARAPRLLEQVTILDPFDPAAGFPLNLAHLPLTMVDADVRSQQLAGLVAELSSANSAMKHLSVGARQVDVLTNVIRAAISSEHPARSLLWALDALVLPDGLKRLAAQTNSDAAKRFLLTAMVSDELRASCASRLRSAIAPSEMLARLGGAPTCISFEALLAPGRMTIVDIGSPPAGLVSAGVFIANALTRLATDFLTERRTPYRGGHTRLCIDEIQVVAPALASVAEHLYATARSRHASVIAMTQQTTIVRKSAPTLLATMMANSPTKLLGRLGVGDAELIAKEVSPAPGVDESLSRLRQRITSRLATAPDRTFLVLRPDTPTTVMRTIDIELEAWDRAAEEHADAIRAARLRLAVPSTFRPTRLHEAQPVAPGSPRVTGNAAPPASPVPRKPPRSRWG